MARLPAATSGSAPTDGPDEPPPDEAAPPEPHPAAVLRPLPLLLTSDSAVGRLALLRDGVLLLLGYGHALTTIATGAAQARPADGIVRLRYAPPHPPAKGGGGGGGGGSGSGADTPPLPACRRAPTTTTAAAAAAAGLLHPPPGFPGFPDNVNGLP